MSTLPPERTMQVLPFCAGLTREASSAETPTAPPPSTYIFERSKRIIIASATLSSSTSTSSSTQVSISGRVMSPGCLTAMPSANVGTAPVGALPYIYGAHEEICTPIILTSGRCCLIASAVPEIKPPPPSGTITSDSSEISSSSSRPSVPCPATTSTSSYG